MERAERRPVMRVFPVVHIGDTTVAVEQVTVAFESGADGVYLIDHRGRGVEAVAEVFNQATARYPDRFIGINLLGHQPADGMTWIADSTRTGRLGCAPDGLWVDDIVRDRSLGAALAIRDADPCLNGVGIRGGVAFKYTSGYTDDPAQAAEQAAALEPYLDVITTSGAGTGSAANPEKPRAMRRAASKPLALASGVSGSNIETYRGSVDEVLVSSSVETAPYSGIFDTAELERLIAAAHRHSGEDHG